MIAQVTTGVRKCGFSSESGNNGATRGPECTVAAPSRRAAPSGRLRSARTREDGRMRAAVLEARGEALRVHEDVEIEKPRPGWVRVRVAHCGLCHSDLALADGTFPGPLPVVLGHEASGVVESVGPEVAGLAPGDPVVLTPCPPCGRCAWCVRGQASLCEENRGIGTGTLPDGTTPLSRGGKPVHRGLNLGAMA